MSDLDDKLERFIVMEPETDKDITDAIAELKQVLAEAGYVESKPTLDIMMAQMQELVDKLRTELTRLKQTNGFVYTGKSQMVLEGVMTGRTFYDRFLDGLMFIENEHVRDHVLSNARRAAGLEDTEPN